MVPDMPLVQIDRVAFMETRFHPDGCVFTERRLADPRIDPLASSAIGLTLCIEGFRACFRVASAFPGKTALALLSVLVPPANQPAVSAQVLPGRIQPVPPRLCSLEGVLPGLGLVLCQWSETVTRPLAAHGTNASRHLGDSGDGGRHAQLSDRSRDNATGTVWPSEYRENELFPQ